jgi:hypothetical protein
MGTSLNGLTPSATYTGLLKFGDNTAISASLKAISDGAGNDTILELSTTALQIGGSTGAFWDNTNKRLGIGTNAPIRKIHVSDNSVGDGPALFEKDVVGGHSEVFAYNKNGSVNATSGQLVSSIAMGAYFNSTYSPSSQEICAIWGIYRGDGTNRKGMLQFRTHDNSGLFPAITIDEFSQVGIGRNATTPLANLHVIGNGTTAATNSLLVQNSAGTDVLEVEDGLEVKVRNTFRVLDTAGNNAMIMYGDGISGIRTLWVNGSVGVGVLGNNASARLQVDSTTQGFLPPRMTTTQKNAIATPASGLQVYDSTVNRASVYSTAWENVITEVNASPNSVSNIWSGSQAQYDALTPNASTLYFIV